MRTVTSILGSVRGLAIIGVSFALAACGSSQNWKDDSPYATVGGTVTGFTGGTLALWNNGGDKLAIVANGPFTFPLQIANGSKYAVVVATQPEGQTCTVTNGSGTANGNVKNVTVACKPYVFERRRLSDIPGDPYSTGKAINYSPYRTAGGPITSEVPSDAEILQDLTLLDLAGFDLLRLFGARAPATDVVAEKILRIAAQNFPEMKFQLGVELKGLTTCSDPANDYNISYLISNLSKYPNVVTISVGNETSFFSRYMPLPCLEGYIRTIRSQVTQPVTADDDWTFYAGKSTFETSERVPVKPDSILQLIDFAAIHMYPFSYTVWDWRQTGVPAGPARAEAMMETSLVALKEWYGEVVDYQYVGADGVTVSVGDSMPIMVTETGWKARQTNPASELEFYAARPENAKWYFDLLYGNPETYEPWQGSEGGPPMIFYFEAYDETWKGIDDGWGLWDISRQARYALCGLPAGPDCNDDVYAGAGYYNPPPFSTVTFDSTSVNYALVGFGGAEDSQVVADPAGGANKVARVNRAATAESFAGTVVGTTYLSIGIMPFDASNTRMSVAVYSPAAGIRVRVKVEDSGNSARSVETEAVTTAAGAWETLTFDFASAVPGTPALNPNVRYDRLIIFFNFGVTGATAGAQTFYFDDVDFIGGGGLPSGPFTDLNFESAGVTYALRGFAGAEDSLVVADPTDATNTVARVNRSATAETFAGTVVSTGANETVGTIPFSATNTTMTVRVYSPAAGIPVRLKVEDATSPGCPNSCTSVETEAVTTGAGWEILTFNFANPFPGTPPLNLSNNYNRLVIFFNFGVSGAQAGAQTYYFDDVLFVTGGGGGGGGGGLVDGVFADDYVGDLPATAKSTQGGDVGFFFDPRLAKDVGATYDYGGVSGTAQDPGGVPNFYYGLGLDAAITDAYFGAFVKSPGNGSVDVSDYTSILVNVWGPDQLFQAGTFPALDVILQGPAVAGCGSASGGSEVKFTFNTTGQGADKVYTLPLGSFTVTSACSGETSVAEVLANIVQVNIVLKDSNIQYVNKDADGVAFTNGLNVGSIKFE